MYDNDTLIDTSNDTALEEYVMEGFTFHSYSGEKLTGNLNVYNMVANAYDATQTYEIGDYVIYDKYLYQCSTAISSPEAWNSAHWTEVTIGDELEEANAGIANTYTKSEVDTTLGNYYTKTQIDTTMGNYYNKTQINNKVDQINANTAAAYSTSSQYNIGDYCLYNGALYRCTTAIPSGEAWTAGHWTSVDIADDMRRVFDVTNDNVAELYDSTKTYALGEFCIYQDNLYRCTTAITTAEAFNALHWTQTNVGDEIVDINTALETKAEIDGYYESMTVGNAEQLVSTVGVSDNAPYTFRTTGGSADVGNRMELRKIIGASVAWNQLIKNGNFASTTDWSGITGLESLSASGNVLTISPSSDNPSNGLSQTSVIPSLVGHKLFASVSIKPSKTTSARFGSGTAAGGLYGDVAKTITANVWNDIVTILNVGSGITSIRINLYSDLDRAIVSGESIQYKNYIVIDLTQMFGSTIADYVYTLESNESGSGIAYLRSYGFLTKPYYAYQSGSMESVCVSSHDEVGFNQFDEDWATGGINDNTGNVNVDSNRVRSNHYIPVLPSTSYYAKVQTGFQMYRFFYDASKNYIGKQNHSENTTFTTPSKAYYMKFYAWKSGWTDYSNPPQVCVNIHWDGERDGEYEPYDLHSYALDSDVTLRGIYKLDASNNLYADGDTYEPDGTVTRKYGIVDMGTLSWTYNSTYSFFQSGTITGCSSDNPLNVVPNALCTRYNTVANAGLDSLGTLPDRTITMRNTYSAVTVKDSAYNDAGVFTTAMSGTYLIYPLATPTTESADPYQLTQVCNDFGTEYFVDYPVSQNTRDVEIPVGTDSYYQNNLRAKLEMSPDSPSGDNDYIVRQTSGENEYVPLANNSIISGLQTRVPTAPSTDGSYHLKAGVESSTPTYFWAEDVLPDDALSDSSTNSVQNKVVKAALDEKANLDAYPHDTASGDLVTIPDGADGIPVRDLSVAIEPVQDLHGQANPYPAGGGKNLFNKDTVTNGYYIAEDGTITELAASCYSVLIPVTVGNTYTYSGKCGSQTNLKRIHGYSDGVWQEQIAFETVSPGANFSITFTIPSGINEIRISALIGDTNSQLESGSSATAYAPYSNICPISGWTGANVTRTGKNLLSPTLYVGVSYDPTIGTTFNTTQHSTQFTDNHDGTFTITTSATWKYFSLLFPMKKGVTYWRKLKFASSGQGGTTTGVLDKDFKVLTKYNSTNATQEFNASISASEDNYAYYYITFTNRGTASATLTITEPQIEVGSSATAYEPYQGRVIPITWQTEAGTVYGGTLNPLTGKLVLDRKGVSLDGNADWTEYATGKFYVSNVTSGAFNDSNNDNRLKFYISNQYLFRGTGNTTSASIDTDKRFYGQNAFNRIWVYDSSYTSLSAFTTALNTTPLQIVYPLATPVEYTLTAEELSTLLGTNNVWADCGQVSLDYRADPTLYIQRLTGSAEDDMIANQNIASGKYFTVNNQLFISTQSIASGDAIVVGTNCTALTLADALNALNA
jgi:hypothetical protein